MEGSHVLAAEVWARQNFARVELGDPRRNRRAVELATAFAKRPGASLPAQLADGAALKAAYRLLDNPQVSQSALAQPHWEHTRQQTEQYPVVLLVQDTTELDNNHHPATDGLGPIGDGRGRGLLVHSTLAVVPAPRTVLGLAYQAPFLRQSVPEARGSGAHSRRYRARESQVWERATPACGRPPAGVRRVHVGDRYADIFDWMERCLAEGCDFLLRAAQDRRVQIEEATVSSVRQVAQHLTAQDHQWLALPARPKRPARQARVAVAWQELQLQAPAHSRHKAPLPVWLIRVWEEAPPPDIEPLDWMLLTSVPTTTLDQAWERRDWYSCRWLDEDYHQCLKSGCQIEQRRLGSAEGLMRLLGFLGPMAAYLLQLREAARLQPQAPALDHLPQDLVHGVALLADLPPAQMTLQVFWLTVARQGGYLGRTRDGPPGWKTLWRGWLYIQTLLDGIRLAKSLPPPSCG